MTLNELKEKARSLPLAPGVYIMKDQHQQVIYVGKAKKLKNRVSQYFQDTSTHSAKTRQMVKHIHQFDVIIAASEFEALVLECSLIKRHMPKYNILLKDDKGYPYVRLDTQSTSFNISIASKVTSDGASYYGPFGSRAVTQNIIDMVRLALRLPNCSKQFPRDVGKGRPCLNYHMDQCAGWCRELCAEDLTHAAEQAHRLLSGEFKQVAESIRQQMLDASDALNFELAARLRNRLQAVEALGKKQFVTAGASADIDAFGFYSTESKSCYSVLHFSQGNLLDKDYEIISLQEDMPGAISDIIKQYYLQRGFAPKQIFLPCAIDDAAPFEQLLHEKYGKKTKIHVPQRGDNLRLVELAMTNAEEEAVRATSKEERLSGTMVLLGKLLCMEIPNRIESYDISHISGTDIVGSLVVFESGKPKKSDYKKFKLRDMEQQDDYAAMSQVLTRRFRHYLEGDKGFDILPDLLLIDGGVIHAQTAQKVLCDLGLQVPVFGMVKDDKHRTRALVTLNGEQINIDVHPSIFSFIGNIQEETHRFAINYHRKLRRKRLQYSQLDDIPGVGPKRKEDLLRRFKSLRAISEASITDLECILPKGVAYSVYQHFHLE